MCIIVGICLHMKWYTFIINLLLGIYDCIVLRTRKPANSADVMTMALSRHSFISIQSSQPPYEVGTSTSPVL